MIDTAALRGLLALATPGNWFHVHGYGLGAGGKSIKLDYDGDENADQRLVVALRNSAEELLDALDAERAKVETLRRALASIEFRAAHLDNLWVAELCSVARAALGALTPPTETKEIP